MASARPSLPIRVALRGHDVHAGRGDVGQQLLGYDEDNDDNELNYAYTTDGHNIVLNIMLLVLVMHIILHMSVITNTSDAYTTECNYAIMLGIVQQLLFDR